ncbi:hypothetical protein M2263_001200 [Providencia alcalifaciens]|nr:hypothetical protein [Providencia alcalifaciens]
MRHDKKPLYRKQNTTTRIHPCDHNSGGEYRWDRSKNKKIDELSSTRLSMKGKINRGYDYTPLFRFLLSKVGFLWNDVFSEAVNRLDKSEPIFWMVSLERFEDREYIRLGESSYYSQLYIDEGGYLQKVNPLFEKEDLPVFCDCCTYTFNGEIVE